MESDHEPPSTAESVMEAVALVAARLGLKGRTA
jgi:hypothetical protein